MRSFYEDRLLPMPPKRYRRNWREIGTYAKVKLCHHKGWFPAAHGTAEQCPRCGLTVTDLDVIRFARAHRVAVDQVRPGRTLAARLNAPWS